MSTPLNTTSLDSVKLLKAEQLAELFFIHVRSVWRQASAGELPAPIHIGGATRWRMVDIKTFIDEQIRSGK